MKTRFLLTLAASIVLALALAACGNATSATSATASPSATSAAPTSTTATSSATPGAEVDFAPASFVQTSVTIHAGQAVRFVDSKQNGGPHLLCLGKNQICDPHATRPHALMLPGIRFMPGDPPTDVVFATPGTYAITCLLHPLMNLTVTVV